MDALAGLTLHRELELEVKAGIPPAKTLQIATWNAAKLLKQEKDRGSIAPGEKADLLLIDGDPAQNISDIRRRRHQARKLTQQPPATPSPPAPVAPSAPGSSFSSSATFPIFPCGFP